MSDRLISHYTQSELHRQIMDGLATVTNGKRNPTIDDLAPVDKFHIGGRQATQHLFEQIDIKSSDTVLDIGSGIGGTARYVANTFGSNVTGIDLTPEFSEISTSLTNLVGLTENVSAIVGSALDLPFENESFDHAYMVHVGMNIQDKARLTAEAYRVVKPGGSFAVYDVMSNSETASLEFPVPWASVSDDSFLAAPTEVESHLENAGFSIESKTNRTEFAVDFFKALAANAASGPPPIGLHLILGNDAKTKIGNMVSNINNGLCGPWEIIARKG